jgi:uncharacterized protein YdaU (DUF1376 family)
VNFYKRHIGDYLKDTAHLSLLEHGVYTRLLDVYYTREAGIPDDQASRLIGARSKDECAALKIVLVEFFKLVDGMWMQDRCEREIHAMSKPDDDDGETKSGKAVRQQRYRDRRKAMFDRLREHGIAMSYDASMDDLQDALLRVTVMPSVTSPVMPSVTPETHNVTATISHKPDSRSQTPEETTSAPSEKISLAADGWLGIPDELLRQWDRAYPAVNIDGELAKAAAWIIANPKNRKSNYARFLTNWLTRAQDNAGRVGGGRSNGHSDSIFG